MNKYYSALVCLLFSLAQISAQTGKYDLSFSLFEVDTQAYKLYIDIQIKAHDDSSTFYLSEQNYRFRYDKNVIVPESGFIKDELGASGYVACDTSENFSVYDVHTLTGSIDSVVSYNVTLIYGKGARVSEEWMSIGRIGFDILDTLKTAKFAYNGRSSFPATFIGELHRDLRYDVKQGELHDLEIDLSEFYGNSDELPNPIKPATYINLAESIDLFPTSAKNFIYLQCNDNNCQNFVIIDIQGRIVQHSNNSVTTKINISEMPKGIYFLHIHTKDGFAIKRFVKI